MPEKLARSIRLGFIGVWVLVAGAISYRACIVGQSEAPQDGQDLQLSRIKEQIVREENRNNAAEIQLPDPDQILPENSAIDNLPLPEPRKDVTTLPGSADLKERDPNPDSETLPPFLGESDEIIFPRRNEPEYRAPDRDAEPPMISEPDRTMERSNESTRTRQAPQSEKPVQPRSQNNDQNRDNTDEGGFQDMQLLPEKSQN